ncbi:hypothetical protein [Hyphomicrobium sp. ghe19]|uniref:hypothetical protein n=1 Tax=Hyphomicrobium sp. ghe19 TaxID=2682968 RepID=UPI0013678465|nr:hypothetical protein HYPP_01955 [Hyphomicrobium sp. ghe19]
MSELERLTILKNIATNGRTFCVLLCAICLAVYLDKRDGSYVWLAIIAAWPIAVSYVLELASLFELTNPRVSLATSLGSGLCSVLVVLFNLLAV